MHLYTLVHTSVVEELADILAVSVKGSNKGSCTWEDLTSGLFSLPEMQKQGQLSVCNSSSWFQGWKQDC